MSIHGELEDIHLGDLIQAVAQTNRSGKLSLQHQDEDGLIVFRQGKIIYAASSSGRQTLGSLLLCKGLINESQLVEALERQMRTDAETRLGTILVQMEAVSNDQVEDAVREQIMQVVFEFMSWGSGRFNFDKMEISDHGEVELDARDFFYTDGLAPEHVLLKIATRLDEMERDRAAGGQTSSVSPAEAPASDSRPAAQPEASTGTMASLKSVLGEIRSPEFTGELSQKILSFTEKLFARGALFAHRNGDLRLMSAFKNGQPQVASAGTGIQTVVSLDEPSILGKSVLGKELLSAQPGRFEADTKIWDLLGGPPAGEEVAVPMTVDGEVLLVLYADSLKPSSSPRWQEELELLLMQAGLSVERAMLEKRIEYYETLRRECDRTSGVAEARTRSTVQAPSS